ncbi:CD63 protein, partial [Acromyrmex insinuator]
MGTRKLGISRAFVCCSNIIFLMSGFVLMSLGGLLLADNERILLSRLLGPVTLGFLIAITGLLGCWAACLFNRCITISYLLTIILLLLGECTVCIIAVFWPHILGIDVRPARLIRALQRSYAVPGREQFTAALDLAQTIFTCCGINGSSNYGTSWWRLQEVGRRELVVPLSCCTLNNANETSSFLNPEPANLTLCQALNPAEHQYARHTMGCLEHIEKWTQDQALILLAIVLVVMFVEVTTLLSILLACSHDNRRSKSQASTFTSTQTLSPFSENDHDFRRTAVDVKDMNKRETCDDTKYNELAMNGKSIIEEWRNPPKYSEDLLRSDQMYEERAIDVVIDNRPPLNLPKRHPQYASLSKIVDNDTNKNNNDDELIKIKRPQGGGTVRSIPIKDYQASIAHNIGTLRRSVAPQSQFESLVSEPEKSVYVPLRKRIPLTNNLHHRSASQTTCIAAQTLKADNVRKKSCCFCDSQHNSRGFCCANADSSKHVKDIRYFNETEDRRSQDALQLAEGHVGQKISVYEQNAQRSLRDANPRYRSFEIKGYRTIGVPLVGMHNACGLPVVASWHDHELLDSLRITRKFAKPAGPIYKSPPTIPNVRQRTQPRRKVLQPDRGMIHPRDIDRGVKRSIVKSVGYLDAINGGRSRRKHRRSSFTMAKMGSLSSKNSFKRMPRRYGIKASSLVDTFGRKSIKGGNAKRTTLYAKDDGEEPVQVLKSLCLNPLARANPETDIMW